MSRETHYLGVFPKNDPITKKPISALDWFIGMTLLMLYAILIPATAYLLVWLT